MARRRRLTYIDVALGLVEVTIASMREQPERAAAYGEQVMRSTAYAAVPGREMHEFGVLLGQALWTPAITHLVEPMWQATEGASQEMSRGGTLVAVARGGRPDLLGEANVRLHLADTYAAWTPNWTGTGVFAGLARTAFLILGH